MSPWFLVGAFLLMATPASASPTDDAPDQTESEDPGLDETPDQADQADQVDAPPSPVPEPPAPPHQDHDTGHSHDAVGQHAHGPDDHPGPDHDHGSDADTPGVEPEAEVELPAETAPLPSPPDGPGTDEWHRPRGEWTKDLFLGANALITRGPQNTGLVDYGLHVRYRLGHFLSVGLGGVSLGYARLLRGTRWGISGGPYLEGHKLLETGIEAYARLTFRGQARFGGGIDGTQGASAGADLGVRLWAPGVGSLGIVTRVVATLGHGYLFTPRVLPQQAVAWLVGIEGEVGLR